MSSAAFSCLRSMGRLSVYSWWISRVAGAAATSESFIGDLPRCVAGATPALGLSQRAFGSDGPLNTSTLYSSRVEQKNRTTFRDHNDSHSRQSGYSYESVTFRPRLTTGLALLSLKLIFLPRSTPATTSPSPGHQLNRDERRN